MWPIVIFNTSLHEIFTRLTDYTLGVALGVCAAVVWVSYGVAQKVLLRRMASQQILLLLYTLCAIALFPLAKPAVIFQLSGWQFACLLFCGVNTLVGYGALAEAGGTLAGSAGKRTHHIDAIVYLVFQFYWRWLGQICLPHRPSTLSGTQVHSWWWQVQCFPQLVTAGGHVGQK